MKAGKSSATATVLPSLVQSARAASKVSSSWAMPRISSTSCMTGTGFMKWMPMKRSGRSVVEARRVMEIDEVLVARIASGFTTGQTDWKILTLTCSFSVAASMTRSQSPRWASCGGRLDAHQRLLPLLLADEVLRQLTAHIAVDGGQARLDAVFGDVVQGHVDAGESRHMRDAVAHLPGADHAILRMSMVPPVHGRALSRAAVRSKRTGGHLYDGLAADAIPIAGRRPAGRRSPMRIARRQGRGLLPARRDQPYLPSSFSSSGEQREEVTHQAVVGDLEDRRLLVLVDGDDDLGVLHAGEGWMAPEMPTAM